MPRIAIVVALAVSIGVLASSSAVAAPPPEGALIQLPPPDACWADTASSGCSDDPFNSFLAPLDILVTPDGLDVLIANQSDDMGMWRRNPATGTVAPAGETPIGGFGSFNGVAVNGAGSRVYSAAGSTSGDGRVQAFSRNAASGVLTALACADEDGGDGCANVSGIGGGSDVAVPSSGPGVYVAGGWDGGDGDGDTLGDGAFVVLSSSSTTGAFSQLTCIPAVDEGGLFNPCNVSGDEPALDGVTTVAVAPGDQHVYAGGFGGIVGWNRDAATGIVGSRVTCMRRLSSVPLCPQETGLINMTDVTLSPDGETLYMGSGVHLAVFDRQPLSGALSFVECFRGSGGAGSCPLVPQFDGATGIAVSPDGRFVYTAGGGFPDGGQVISWARDPGTGKLTALDCESYAPATGCSPAAGLKDAQVVAVSRDGRNVYVGSVEGIGAGEQGALSLFQIERPPSCADGSTSVASGATVALPLVCSDPNGEPITRSITTAPAHGTLGAVDEAAGTVAYTVAAGYSGADSVGFRATDGTNQSGLATVSINVTPPPGGAGVDNGPRSRITSPKGAVRASKLKRLRGTATDDKGVARVEIALLRLLNRAKPAAVKKRCRILASSGRFKRSTIRRGRCVLRGFLRAKGTASWRFTLKKRLPKGSYALYSRATDTAGQRETSFSAKRRNRVLFKVR